MKSNIFKCFLILLAVATACIVLYSLWPSDQSTVHERNQRSAARLTARKPRTVQSVASARDAKLKEQPVRRAKKRRKPWQIPDEVSAAERTILNSVDNALNAEDFEEVLRLTKKLENSTNEIARLRVVEALGWFDDAALPELTPFLMDADEGVRYSARDQWMASLDQVEDIDLKASVIEATMQVVTDPDLLEDIAFNFHDMPTFTAIDSLVALIHGDNEAAAEAACETYSFLTGCEYSTLEDAQRWVDENVESDNEPDDMPVYRASRHPEVFDPDIDLTGLKIVNDTDYELPSRTEEARSETVDAQSSPSSDGATVDDYGSEDETEE